METRNNKWKHKMTNGNTKLQMGTPNAHISTIKGSCC